jgi:hypothetical protein
MADAPGPGIDGRLLFYTRPEPLMLDRHRRLGIRSVDGPFKFVAASNLVPIMINEFPRAAACYPLVFLGPERHPVAVMGARDGENLFVSAAGEIDPEAYMPAYARRYPFTLVQDPASASKVVCIDAAAEMICEAPENPFFNGDQPSSFTRRAIAFCEEFETSRYATRVFVDRMTEFGLWEEKSVTVTSTDPNGADAPLMVGAYFAISEQALMALAPAKLVALRDDGWLAPIFAHLMSLLVWPRIIARAFGDDER